MPGDEYVSAALERQLLYVGSADKTVGARFQILGIGVSRVDGW